MTQNISKLLDQLDPKSKYQFIKRNPKHLPTKVVKEAIRYFYLLGPSGQGEAIRLAQGKGLLEEVVEMYVSMGEVKEVMAYPEIVKSRSDVQRIFDQLEMRLGSAPFMVHNQYRHSVASTEYALSLYEFGRQIEIPAERLEELLMRAVCFTEEASKAERGTYTGNFPFSSIPRIIKLLGQKGRQEKARHLCELTLDQMKKNRSHDFNGKGERAFVQNPELYLQMAENCYGDKDQAKEDFNRALEEYFEELNLLDPNKTIDDQKDWSFSERSIILKVMKTYHHPHLDKYKRCSVEHWMGSSRRTLQEWESNCDQEEFQKQLSYAEELQDHGLKRRLYLAAIQKTDSKKIADQLLEEAITLQDLTLIERMVQSYLSKERDVWRDINAREDLTKLADKYDLFEKLKPFLGEGFPEYPVGIGRVVDMNYYALARKIKGDGFLGRIYDRDILRLEELGWIHSALEIAQFMHDERRIAKYEPIVNYIKQQEAMGVER